MLMLREVIVKHSMVGKSVSEVSHIELLHGSTAKWARLALVLDEVGASMAHDIVAARTQQPLAGRAHAYHALPQWILSPIFGHSYLCASGLDKLTEAVARCSTGKPLLRYGFCALHS
mmetsp:Transcript_44594/g.83569  ORF Transcript_44594/g.83569 Transcript_44594/m.83569 type:complete len:117 (+) Transcript_44594:21-371(+)